MTGATSLQTNILAWLTPVAIILVMVLGAMAMANRIAQVFARASRHVHRAIGPVGTSGLRPHELTAHVLLVGLADVDSIAAVARERGPQGPY